MIQTSIQLKALIRNKSKGVSSNAQALIRCYMMERFLERLSCSQYRNFIIIKGGLLLTSILGIENRSTMDLDATIQNFSFDQERLHKVTQEICLIKLDDGIHFDIIRSQSIMSESQYPGIRFHMKATLESMKISFYIDYSAGDVITPCHMKYLFPMLFESRNISLFTYNIETILAEKFETIISRGVSNTRMRDFYDIHVLLNNKIDIIDSLILSEAIINTTKNRGSYSLIQDYKVIINEIQYNKAMYSLWKDYQSKFDYATYISWDDVIVSIQQLKSILEIR